MRPGRGLLFAALLLLCACGAPPTGPGGDPGSTCPADKTIFYCSSQGLACSSNDDCCGSLSCDPSTRACTDGGLTGLDAGSRCSNDSPCITDIDPSARENLGGGRSWPVNCLQSAGICEWTDPQGSVAYCSQAGQACNGNGDCCGSLWCDRDAGTCTDGRTLVPAGHRCSSATLCQAGQVIDGQSRDLFCDADNVCKFAPYCAR